MRNTVISFRRRDVVIVQLCIIEIRRFFVLCNICVLFRLLKSAMFLNDCIFKGYWGVLTVKLFSMFYLLLFSGVYETIAHYSFKILHAFLQLVYQSHRLIDF